MGAVPAGGAARGGEAVRRAEVAVGVATARLRPNRSSAESAHPFPSRPAPEAAGEAACGQGLRLRSPAAMTPFAEPAPCRSPSDCLNRVREML